jgi:hypothetical protein
MLVHDTPPPVDLLQSRARTRDQESGFLGVQELRDPGTCPAAIPRRGVQYQQYAGVLSPGGEQSGADHRKPELRPSGRILGSSAANSIWPQIVFLTRDLRPWGAPLTKRALAGGDSESFLPKAAASRSGQRGGRCRHIREEACHPTIWPTFPRKCRSCVNQKAERISKSEIFGSPDRIRTDSLLVNNGDRNRPVLVVCENEAPSISGLTSRL